MPDCVLFSGDHEEIWVLLCTYRLQVLTFCHSMIRMMREMTVRTTKARMAEITTTLKGRAEHRAKNSHKQTVTGSCSPHLIVGITDPLDLFRLHISPYCLDSWPQGPHSGLTGKPQSLSMTPCSDLSWAQAGLCIILPGYENPLLVPEHCPCLSQHSAP